MDIATKLLNEIPSFHCGPERLELRKRFNTQEINASKLIAKYDNDGDKGLQANELKNLLKDYNKGKKVKTDDLAFIMAVADQNCDKCISQAEVLFAMRAWYALNNMPERVGRAIGETRGRFGAMPSDEKLKHMLELCNEGQPVGYEGVKHVKDTAIQLGATEKHVSAAQMRKAVATWYLNVERGDTDAKHLIMHSIEEVHAIISKGNPIRQLLAGELDTESKSTLLFMILVFVLIVVFPGVDVAVAKMSPSTYECEHPDLSDTLWWTGAVGFALAGSLTLLMFVFASAGSEPHRGKHAKFIAGVLSLVMFLIFSVMNLVGMIHIMSATSMRCGALLWHWCHFVYCELPFGLCGLICCGVPCLYCTLGGATVAHNHFVDKDLHN